MPSVFISGIHIICHRSTVKCLPIEEFLKEKVLLAPRVRTGVFDLVVNGYKKNVLRVSKVLFFQSPIESKFGFSHFPLFLLLRSCKNSGLGYCSVFRGSMDEFL